MSVVRGAVGCAVVALLAGHQLATMTPAQRDALWASMHAVAAPAVADHAVERKPVLLPRVAVAPLPGGGETVAPDALGQFHTQIEIGGQRLSAVVDTGASFVALSYEDADRLGIRPMPADFRYPVSTANGRAFVAKVDLPSVRLGGIEVRDVTALVGGRGQLGQTLLGMSFLSRLSSVRMERGRLVLER